MWPCEKVTAVQVEAKFQEAIAQGVDVLLTSGELF
jgi:hypothetical protein